jgi:hypothetical protein
MPRAHFGEQNAIEYKPVFQRVGYFLAFTSGLLQRTVNIYLYFTIRLFYIILNKEVQYESKSNRRKSRLDFW